MDGILHRRDTDWAVRAVILGVAKRMRFELAEIRQHVAKGPALVPRRRPVVEIVRLAAHVDHRVDRAGAALHFAAWAIDRPVVEFLLGLAVVHPVVGFVVVRLGETHRDLEPERAVLAARFEQQHRMVTRRRKAIGENAARRTRADDNVIVVHALCRQTAPNPLNA